jgi:hypothetical protein
MLDHTASFSSIFPIIIPLLSCSLPLILLQEDPTLTLFYQHLPPSQHRVRPIASLQHWIGLHCNTLYLLYALTLAPVVAAAPILEDARLAKASLYSSMTSFCRQAEVALQPSLFTKGHTSARHT